MSETALNLTRQPLVRARPRFELGEDRPDVLAVTVLDGATEVNNPS